jgi:subtilisin family serine protease
VPARASSLVAACAALFVLVVVTSRYDFVPAQHKAERRATVHVAGVLRKPPIRRAAHHLAAVEKKRPKGRIVTPRPTPRKRAARPAVEQSVPAAAVTPNDPLWANSWSLAKVNAPAAWKLTSGTAETIVAVLDTGVDLGHPDLQGAFVPGYDFVNRDEDPSDDHGHGTMVAGVIAARSNNRIGGAGTCSRCSVMAVKVIAGNGTGNAADVAAGIAWAVEHGARVINLSFVLSGPDEGVAQAIAYARARGAVVVAAAGNAGSSDMTVPAGLPGVVSVTGTDSADVRYSWASYGSWVRLAAPGCSQTTAPAGGYGDFCGTSSAAAFVSGLAGLARSFAAGAPADAIADALAARAIPVGDFVSAGRVDAAAALGALKPAAQPQPDPAAPAAPPTANAASPLE